jgi:hypothetical protein
MASPPEPDRDLEQLLERAANDPALRRRLAADLLATAQAEGVRNVEAHLKALLGRPDASDAELAAILRQRIPSLTYDEYEETRVGSEGIMRCQPGDNEALAPGS